MLIAEVEYRDDTLTPETLWITELGFTFSENGWASKIDPDRDEIKFLLSLLDVDKNCFLFFIVRDANVKKLNVGISDYDRVRVGYRPPKTFGTRADRWLIDPSFLDSDEMVLDRDRARRRVPISQTVTKDMAFDVIIYYIRTGDIPRELEWRN
ncbi:MAG: hypothetical protein L0154_28340 [Chloroflexi bacterium]|nr:hypothetical protein [Chloroflexota bacterium]